MTQTINRFTFLGCPGAGKGFFAQIISKRLGYTHLCVGDEIRRTVSRIENKVLKEIVSSGKLLPCEIVNDIVSTSLKTIDPGKGVILDGFPRTVLQAKYLDECTSFKVIKFELDRSIIMEKLLGRRTCITCNGNFNVCAIQRDGYDMPAILPNAKICGLNGMNICNPQLESRSDDTKETILTRFSIYDREIAQILDYYKGKKEIKTFVVRKGEKDVDNVIRLMEV